jgi:hypothetical protein
MRINFFPVEIAALADYHRRSGAAQFAADETGSSRKSASNLD